MNTHTANIRQMKQEAQKPSKINVSVKVYTQHLFSVNYTAYAEHFVHIDGANERSVSPVGCPRSGSDSSLLARQGE
jgi:hypothetical protein